VRHIHTDGRPHPDTAIAFPTPAGHSIGQYEGGTVVDTVGMTAERSRAATIVPPKQIVKWRYRFALARIKTCPVISVTGTNR
jgi:hypothetical protein